MRQGDTKSANTTISWKDFEGAYNTIKILRDNLGGDISLNAVAVLFEVAREDTTHEDHTRRVREQNFPEMAGLAQVELARRLGSRKGASWITRNAKLLFPEPIGKLGLVDTDRAPSDRRRAFLMLTRPGRNLIKKLIKAATKGSK